MNVNGVGTWDDNFIQKFTMYSFKSIVESMTNVNGVWDDNFIQKFTMYSFKSIVESKANVNGVWDDNSLFIQISVALVAKKRKLRLHTALSRSFGMFGVYYIFFLFEYIFECIGMYNECLKSRGRPLFQDREVVELSEERRGCLGSRRCFWGHWPCRGRRRTVRISGKSTSFGYNE